MIKTGPHNGALCHDMLFLFIHPLLPPISVYHKGLQINCNPFNPRRRCPALTEPRPAEP